MKVLEIKGGRDINYSNEKKELVNSRELIAFKDDQFHSLVTVRWYMGRSSSASTVYCNVFATSTSLSDCDYVCASGSAGGGGYCKQSAAFYDACHKAGIKFDEEISGRGMSVVEEALRALGEHAGFKTMYISRG